MKKLFLILICAAACAFGQDRYSATRYAAQNEFADATRAAATRANADYTPAIGVESSRVITLEDRYARDAEYQAKTDRIKQSPKLLKLIYAEEIGAPATLADAAKIEYWRICAKYPFAPDIVDNAYPATLVWYQLKEWKENGADTRTYFKLLEKTGARYEKFLNQKNGK